MAPSTLHGAYKYVLTPSGQPKILPVDEMSCKDEESPAEYNTGGYCPVKLNDTFKLGRYRVLRKLGWGHFSTVWLVKDTELNRHTALKVVKSAGRYAETARDEIKLLSRVSLRLSSPSRTPAYRLGPEASHICIVFEPLGEHLLALIERNKRKGVPRALVKVIAKQVLLGLEYLHDECDLVHTDIKTGEHISKSTPVTAANSKANSPTSPPSTSSSSSSISSIPFTTAGSVGTPPTSLSNSFGNAMAAIVHATQQSEKKVAAPSQPAPQERVGLPMKGKKQTGMDCELDSTSWKDKLVPSPTREHEIQFRDIGVELVEGPGTVRSPPLRLLFQRCQQPPAFRECYHNLVGEFDRDRDQGATFAERYASDRPASKSASNTSAKHPLRVSAPLHTSQIPSALTHPSPTCDSHDGHNNPRPAAAAPAPLPPMSPSSAASLTPTPASPPPSMSPAPTAPTTAHPPPDAPLPQLHTPALALPKPRPSFAPEISIKIADLGNATPSKKHFTEDIQTRQYRSPRGDYRAPRLGHARRHLERGVFGAFAPRAGKGDLFSKDDDHMAQIIELLGDFSLDVHLRYIKTLKPWPLKRVMMEKYLWSEPDTAVFCSFLEPMLSVDQRNRADAKDMLTHPWLEVTAADDVVGEW
ncbi:kinase-like domain-containing protein [Mycena olivaceomarginata]|nr:kinase-like domain-containing protein [Mycena olivaceomarginata]